jgi:hypothetical protein
VLPEIIGFTKSVNPFRRNADFFIPYFKSLFVVFINGRIKPVRIQPDNFRQKFPAPCNRLMLEIISEGEIPQHLEKGQMPGCLAYILKIACPDALLACRHPAPGRYFLSGKIRL